MNYSNLQTFLNKIRNIPLISAIFRIDSNEEDSYSSHRMTARQSFVFWTLVVVIITIITSSFAVGHFASKNREAQLLTQIEEIYNATLEGEHTYDAIFKGVCEIGSLIEESGANGKAYYYYNDLLGYSDDLKTIPSIEEMLYNNDAMTTEVFSDINKSVQNLKTLRAREFFLTKDEGKNLAELEFIARRIVGAKAIFNIQQSFTRDNPDNLIAYIVYLGEEYLLGSYTDDKLARYSDTLGVNSRLLRTNSDLFRMREYRILIPTKAFNEIKINNDAKGFAVLYRDPRTDPQAATRKDNDFNMINAQVYPVGYTITAELNNRRIDYLVTRYDGKKIEEFIMSAAELCNYVVLIPN